MGSIAAFGDNVICEMLDKKDETIMGKIVSIASKKLKVGDIVFYNERNYDNLNVGNKVYHAVWMNFIRAVGIDKEEIQKIVDDLPDLRMSKYDKEQIDKELKARKNK